MLVEGYLTKILVDGNAFAGFGNEASLELTKPGGSVPAFEQDFQDAVGGPVAGRLNVRGRYDPALMEALFTSYLKNTPVTFSLEETKTVAGGGTTGATFSGNAILQDFSPVETTGDGHVRWSFVGITDGAIAFAAPAP